MKKFWILSAVVIAAFGLVYVGSVKTSAQRKRRTIVRAQSPVPNRYIVTFGGSSVATNAMAPQVEAAGQYLTNVYGGEIKEVYSDVVKGMTVEMSEEQAQAMMSDPEVVSIEEDGYITLADTQATAPWHLDRIDQRNMPLDSTYGYGSNGAGVHVYILDTGIRPTHAEFGGRASIAADFVGDGQNGNDCNGHGTHVAGIVGSATYGVAKGAYLHGVRVMACDGTGQISTLISGVNWVTTNHQSPAAANISLTAAGTSPALESAITNSIASGVTYAIAAGNSNADACGYTPARTPNAITVGASLNTDARAQFSNWGTCIDIFAPGYNIVSTWASSDTATAAQSGTSMSAPMVAGAAAIYLSTNPSASPASVAQVITSAATAGVMIMNESYSPNRLLYTWLTGGPGATPTPTPTVTPTPTPTVTPTPTPTPSARITVQKKLKNTNTSSTSTVAFPYTATGLAAPSFTLSDNTTYQDSNVQALGPGNPVVVTETSVPGYQLTSISCAETVNGTSVTPNTTVDLASKTATITAQAGSDILCTYTSEPIAPTAADAYVSGRVAESNGRGASGVLVTLTDLTTGESKTAITNPFGYYGFQGMSVAHNYMASVASNKRWTSTNPTRTFTLYDNLAGMDFIVKRK